ncbi:MAG: hypothetical protein SAK29_38585, partial [Scytonema sp. PMC 1069.18]|nr:hypothetical protein [Scytonema sp. PMC 1069.18]
MKFFKYGFQAVVLSELSPMPCAVILTAIRLEYMAIRTYLTHLEEEIHPEGTIYERGKFVSNNQSWDVGIVEIGTGNAGGAFEAERAIAYFKPSVVLFVGVAGGIKDVAVGDVVAVTKVYGYESGKAKRSSFESRPDVGQSTYALISRARAEARKQDWLQTIKAPRGDRTPKVLVAPIASGDKVIASKHSSLFRFLQSNCGDVIAVEMEGRGFFQATHANQDVKALIIRGISHLIKSNNHINKEVCQELAARHASAFAFEILAKFEERELVNLSDNNNNLY